MSVWGDRWTVDPLPTPSTPLAVAPRLTKAHAARKEPASTRRTGLPSVLAAIAVQTGRGVKATVSAKHRRRR